MSLSKDQIKKVQSLVGVTADGVMGPKTIAAIKAWQASHGLTADGIVGSKTWAAMFGNEHATVDPKCVDPSVVYLPLSVHVSKLPGRSIRYIAIHYTAGASSAPGSARAVRNVFVKREASADFAVDDNECVQFNPDLNNYYCWAVGDKKNPYSSGGKLNGIAFNRNTISIEVCSNLKKGTSASAANHSGWTFTDAEIENTLKLVRILMKKFGIPKERVVRHYDITGKLCPGVIGWNNEKIYDAVTGKATSAKSDSKAWEEFKARL